MTDGIDDREALAADYVFGSLDAAERQRAAQLIDEDPEFARMVEDWTRRLSPLAEGTPPVSPPDTVWSSIRARLPKGSTAATPAAIAFWDRVAVWRWMTAVAGTAAAALAIYIGAGADPELTQQTQFVAVLEQHAGQPAWFVTVDLKAGLLTVRPVSAESYPDKAFELWLVEGEGAPPRSLGLLHADQEVQLPASVVSSPSVARNAVLAVSLEPEGGSPTGQPTGPVVFHGSLIPLSE